jgi:LPS export ABC transporter protein LptC
MPQAAKLLTGFFLPAILIAILLTACENDLKKVQQISAKELNNPTDSSIAVDVTYSDSGRVKARLITPLLLDFKTLSRPYREMPKGVKIVFYDKDLKPMTTVVSDYAITSNNDNIITLRKNVVVNNVAGDNLKSNELIWDKLKKTMFSNQPVVLSKADGTVLHYTNFTSNENFSDYTGQGGYGTIITKGNIAQ